MSTSEHTRKKGWLCGVIHDFICWGGHLMPAFVNRVWCWSHMFKMLTARENQYTTAVEALIVKNYTIVNGILRHWWTIHCIHRHFSFFKYRVIRNDCRGVNNLSYTIHLILQMQPHVLCFYGVTSRIRFLFLLFPQVSRNWRLLHATDSWKELQVVETPTILSNNPVYSRTLSSLEDNVKMASKGRNM